MAHRSFTDRAGRTWQVWATRPGPRSKVSPGLETGWLTFEAAGEASGEAVGGAAKRRLAPIPPNWETASATELQLMVNKAKPVALSRRKVQSVATILEDSGAPSERPTA